MATKANTIAHYLKSKDPLFFHNRQSGPPMFPQEMVLPTILVNLPSFK